MVGEGSESVGDDTSSAEVVLIERRYAFSGQVVGDSGAEDMISVSKVHCELDLLLSTGVYEEGSISVRSQAAKGQAIHDTYMQVLRSNRVDAAYVEGRGRHRVLPAE